MDNSLKAQEEGYGLSPEETANVTEYLVKLDIFQVICV